MHPEARQWVEASIDGFTPKRVLEIGSRNVNGGVRDLFPDSVYIGVDIIDGPGVDVVGDATELDLPPVDLVVTTEALEHHPNPGLVIETAYRVLVPGGMLIATMAGPGRHPHSGLLEGRPKPGEHYRNIEPDELAEWLAGWADVVIDLAGRDLRCRARKGDRHA